MHKSFLSVLLQIFRSARRSILDHARVDVLSKRHRSAKIGVASSLKSQYGDLGAQKSDFLIAADDTALHFAHVVCKILAFT